MKSQETNSLRRALGAGELHGDHPDAGVLSAFAEGGLIARERHEVLGHLATCAACREVLSLTADGEESSGVANATDTVVVMPRPESRRVWRLSLAGIAASLIVAASAGLIYERSREEGQAVPGGNADRLAVTSREPVEEPKPAAEAGPRSASPLAQREAGHAVAKKSGADREEERRAAKQETVTQLSGSPVAPIDSLEPKEAKEALQADLRTAANTQVNASDVTPGPDLAPGLASPPAPALAMPKSPKSGLASSNAAAMRGATSSSGCGSAAGFVNGAAKGATGANGAGGGLARPRWRIDESGRVERSFGNDEWQVMLLDEHSTMRVISVSGGEVWVGGDDLRLFHSSDNGGTWRSIALPSHQNESGGQAHSQAGSRAIVHIVFQSPLSGFVQAEDGTEWTTSDGGSRWGRVN